MIEAVYSGGSGDEPQRPTSGSYYRNTLLSGMKHAHFRLVKPERGHVLRNIGLIIRDDLDLVPATAHEATVRLLSLRRAIRAVYHFYHHLDPIAMKIIAPWGALVKLQCLEAQVTEVIFTLHALEMLDAPSTNRVQLQLAVWSMYPIMYASYDDVVRQLAALLVKVAEAEKEEVTQ
jgi:hypothetical protein